MKRDGIYERSDCGGFYVSYVDALGHRCRIKAEGCHTRTQAKDFLNQLKGKVAQERHFGIREVSDISTEDLFKRYEAHQSGLRSLERTKQILRRWLQALPATAKDITREQIDRQVTKRREEKAAPASISKEVTILRHVFRLAIEWELLHRNPTDGVKLPKVSNSRLRYLTPGEFKRALQRAPEWMRAPLALACFTGCRRGELCAMRWPDINFPMRQLYIPQSKTGEARTVQLNNLAMEILESLPRMDDLVLPGVDPGRLSTETKRLFKRLGFEGVSFHTLRHTCASWLVMQGADLLAVGRLLGHRTAKMTARYAHLSPEFMQATVNKLDQKFLQDGTITSQQRAES